MGILCGSGVLASRVRSSLGSSITLSTALSSTTTRSSVGLSVGFALFKFFFEEVKSLFNVREDAFVHLNGVALSISKCTLIMT